MKESTKAIRKLDASLPWRTSLESSANSIDELEEQMNVALLVLTDKQRKFVILLASGATQREAYKEAGYSQRAGQQTQDEMASTTTRLPQVKEGIRLAKMWHMLKYGIESVWKRQQLVNLYAMCTTPGEDTWNPNAANKSMQLLMQMDGDIVPHNHANPNGNGSTTIHISTGVPARDPAQLSVNGLVLRDDGMITHVEE